MFVYELSGCGFESRCSQHLLELSEELHKLIIRKHEKRKVYLYLKDNIWGAGLADMQLICILNKKIRFLLCVINIYSKYAWLVHLKDKKGITIINAYQKILDESGCKTDKIWVEKES